MSTTTEKNIELLRAEMTRLLALGGRRRGRARFERDMKVDFMRLVEATTANQDVAYWTENAVISIGFCAKLLGVPLQIKLQNDGTVVNM